ncbi:multidrug effflux MFS transporter [Actinotalea sp.]|uniref:multidrug effflux MFS transporter n=1 Tax=Actinotalea sp. TaxID=1872145 RepID=UPI002CE6C237|nr:multidrug effflux MFS transporter [Actinotalea sp.]HQY33404.1 multidrug effflux MFS transporter [Actinotalea sp.]HRA50497.1 multidrug effflux MFS transporter [Actinotalea sp.]
MPTLTAGSARQARGSERSVGFVILVGSLTLLPALATDMYLPSLPEVAGEMGTTDAAVQFTITGMLIGGAIGQLIVGPFSDRVGRRRPVMIGVGLHALMSLLCALAVTIEQLQALRVLQGLASAGATVVAMAIIRDRYTGSEAARLMSRLVLVIAVAPLFAPTIGGVIADAWGWRAVFVALALLAGVLLAVVAVALPETLPAERRAAHGLGALAHGYVGILRDRRFVALAVVPGFGMAVIMAYVSGSPFVLRDEYGLTAQQFSLAFAIGGTALVLGSQLNAALVRRVGPMRLLRFGAPATTVLTAVLVVVAATRAGGVVGFIAALWLSLSLLGLVLGNASALALSRHGERAGTAAATLGFIQTALAGAVSPLVGVLGGGALAMTGVMLGSMVAATLVLALATPAYRRGGWLEPIGPPVGTH